MTRALSWIAAGSRRTRCAVAVLSMLSVGPTAALAAGQPLSQATDEAAAQLRRAEDARARTPDQRARLRDGLAHGDVAIRTQAARAVGRLEDAEWLPALAPLLEDPSIDVRAEAAWALAQATDDASAASTLALLRAQLARESDSMVRGALATSLGRLPFGEPATVDAAGAALAELMATTPTPGAVTSTLVTLGVARGTHALARRCAARRFECRSTTVLLARLYDEHRPDRTRLAPAVAARVRRLAALGLQAVSATDSARIETLLADTDAEVRRVGAVQAAKAAATSDARAAAAMRDRHPLVRYAFLSQSGGRWPALARAALDDGELHVRLAALDALGAAPACGCEAGLASAADDPGRWHTFAHALVAVAHGGAAEARAALPRAVVSPVWQVRMYAAQAAAIAADPETLRHLARDMHPNVREAALAGLDTIEHRASDDLRREALASRDYQLVQRAARGLQGTTEPAAARAALLEALRRLTADDSDTSRDPRLALLDRLAEVADTSTIDEIDAWRQDPDPVVAAQATRIVNEAVGRPAAPAEAAAKAWPHDPLPLPTAADLAAQASTHAVLSMRGTGDVVIRLLPSEAPTNVWRFIRQVEAGEWDGLTFHRVEPGFVVQGGSPGANEYVGADRYTRDERGPLSHVRGTVGISTRGRDTGDGQIFVNLVDNPRLDHAYTIIGQVVAGLEVVDALLEGAVIERARLERR